MTKPTYPGSHWWKFDFHNHTPASSDFHGVEAQTLQPRDWLLAYMRQGIDCVAVTDHNTSDWVEKLQAALVALEAENPQDQDYRPLALFPGIEITTSESLHILAIFSPDTPKAVLDGLLHGKLTLSNPDKPNAGHLFSDSASKVIDDIHSMLGVAIAAHTEKDRGLFEHTLDSAGQLQCQQSWRLIEDILSKVDALECHDGGSPIYNHHQQHILHLATVSGSDAHKTADAGNRFAWIKMSSPSLEGLRLALLDPESAVRRSEYHPHDPQPLPLQWIKSITLENLHLRRHNHGSLKLDFSPAYTGIIGGRGSGKSTVLECLRLALGRESELRKLGEDSEIWKSFDGFRREYVQRDKPGMMLPQTMLSVEVAKGHGASTEQLLFVWSKQTDGKFTTKVSRWDQDCWHDTGLDEQQASTVFPVKIFSQKQVLALANNPQSLLEYIDDSIQDQKKVWLQQFDECKNTLLTARQRIRSLTLAIREKPTLELEYRESSRKARVSANANFGPLLKAYQRATQQQQAMGDFYESLGKHIDSLQQELAKAVTISSVALTQFQSETATEIATFNHAITLRDSLAAQHIQITKLVDAMKVRLDAVQTEQIYNQWQQENNIHIDAYQQEAQRLQSEGINNAQEAADAIVTEERLRRKLAEIGSLEAEIEQATQTVQEAAQALNDCREQLTCLRQEFINNLFAQNNTLKVSLQTMGDTFGSLAHFREILRLGGRDTFSANIWSQPEGQPAHGMLWDVSNVDDSQLIPGKLAELKQSLEEIGQKIHPDNTVLNTRLWLDLTRRIESLPSEAFDELATWFPEDQVTLEYRPKPGSAYRSIKQASAGQKTAAMLSFLLVHGKEPLLLDQPEDDLDNALVSELVVGQLRKNKDQRQLIVVTHNANIVVNADAELVMTMDFNGQITLDSSGGLQEQTVRQAVCRVMEGGEEAFRQRYKRILEDLR